MSTTIPNKRPAPINFEEQLAEAKRRAAEVRARLEASTKPTQNGTNGVNGVNGASSPHTNGAAVPPKTAAELARERVEALKARVAAAKARTSTISKPSTLTNDAPPERPPPQPSAPQKFIPQIPEPEDMPTGARGGLAIGIHPALLGDIQDRKSQRAKARGKKPEVEKVNPYLSEFGSGGRARRELKFTHNLHARPAMQAANEMRRKAALEAMKKRIQAQTVKAGLDESIEIQAFAVPAPPDVEFWDDGLQSGIDSNELISRLVVHPIMIEPPQEKFVTLKEQPLKLTKKEQKKMRRIRRAEEHKEEQAKIRLGLVPKPEPKIKHSNVMRVYGEMAVKDPTAVEAMVNKQVAERKNKHEEANAERQLTKEERAEKIMQKAKENAAMGLTMSVFKIALGKEKLLGKHRYKVDVNAKQYHDLTGCVIAAPSVTLAIIEAGEFSTRKYKKLMLDRIKWQAILEGNGEIQNHDEDAQDGSKDTTCTLLWQGQVRDRKFKKWGSIRDVESDSQAKEALKRAKMENFWTLAKSTDT
jgi:U4/U6 small nuclear ribonucleoprotein PRP3